MTGCELVRISYGNYYSKRCTEDHLNFAVQTYVGLRAAVLRQRKALEAVTRENKCSNNTC